MSFGKGAEETAAAESKAAEQTVPLGREGLCRASQRRRELLQKSRAALLEVLAVASAAFLTYSVANRGPAVGSNIAQATVTTLGCASLPQLCAPLACGAYAGMTSAFADDTEHAWLALVAGGASVAWLVVSRCGLMVGIGGRLGTTAFMGSCLAVLLAAATGAVPWRQFADWSDWREFDVDVSIPSACASFLATGLTIVVRCRAEGGPLAQPVLCASAVGLCSMLIFSVSMDPDYEGVDDVLGGIGQGTFIGMAAATRLPGWGDWLVSGISGGAVQLLLRGSFNGFGGKQGFMAFLSCLPALLFRGLQAKWQSSRAADVAKEETKAAGEAPQDAESIESPGGEELV